MELDTGTKWRKHLNFAVADTRGYTAWAPGAGPALEGLPFDSWGPVARISSCTLDQAGCLANAYFWAPEGFCEMDQHSSLSSYFPGK